mmetsp:Transcript_37733/g.70646  ORF Transcript_37733/g.70646 Transcript_37733/m.70646 type:complete len:657 (+) Transcript_37733:122-2092(+)
MPRVSTAVLRQQALRSSALGPSKYSYLLDTDVPDDDPDSDDDVDTLVGMLQESNSKAHTDAFLRDVRAGTAKAGTTINALLQDKRPAFRLKLTDMLGDLFDMLNFAMGHEPERVLKANMLKSIREIAKDLGLAVASLLHDPDAGVRASAIRAMGKMARYATHSTKQLQDCLNDKSSQVRRCVVACLVVVRCCSMRVYGTLDNERDPEAVQLATGILEDRGGQESIQAVVRLASIGAVPCPQLLALLRDEDPNVCGGAACALGENGPRAAPHAYQLLDLLRAGDSNVRICATIAFRKMGGAAMSQVETLLDDKDHILRRSAVGVLMTILSTAPSSKVTDLAFTLVRDAPSEYGAAATINLVRTGEVRGLELAKLLQDPDTKVRCSAAAALGELGSQAMPYILHLIPLLKDNDCHVREAAIQAVKDLDGYDGFVHDPHVDDRPQGGGAQDADQRSIMQAYKVYNHLRDIYEDNSFQPATRNTYNPTVFRTTGFQPGHRTSIAAPARKKSWISPKKKSLLDVPAATPDSGSTRSSIVSLEGFSSSPKSPTSLSDEVQHAAARRVSQVCMAAQMAEAAEAAAAAAAAAMAPRGMVRNLNRSMKEADDGDSGSAASTTDDMVFLDSNTRASLSSSSASRASVQGMFSIGGSASRMSLVMQS